MSYWRCCCCCSVCCYTVVAAAATAVRHCLPDSKIVTAIRWIWFWNFLSSSKSDWFLYPSSVRSNYTASFCRLIYILGNSGQARSHNGRPPGESKPPFCITIVISLDTLTKFRYETDLVPAIGFALPIVSLVWFSVTWNCNSCMGLRCELWSP